MATYAIGDIQGCHDSFLALLDQLRFEPGRDRLWLVGDLVNRGPRSLEVLRWVYRHRESITLVLGNHDLHLVGRAAGVFGPGKRDTLDDVLAASDCDELIAWLRCQPLLVRDGQRLLVHAGLLPTWSVDEAERRARAAEAFLRRDAYPQLLVEARRKTNPEFGRARLAAAAETLRVLTRVRMLSLDGTPDDQYTGAPSSAPPGLCPWFEARDRKSADTLIVFGHWAALGRRLGQGFMALDSGCVWGGSLTAVRLEDRAVFEQRPCD